MKGLFWFANMDRRKILISLLIIAAVTIGAIVSRSFADDTNYPNPIEIYINNQNPWTETFIWENMEPGQSKEINLAIKNDGNDPVKIWKIIKNVNVSENGIIEPEQEWYDENGVAEKNDMDSAIIYEMFVDGNLAAGKKAGITLDKIKNHYIGLVKLDQPFNPENGDGILYPGKTITVLQKYYFKEDTENWAQSDQMIFDIEIEARQIGASEPLKQISFMDNKYPGWNPTADGRMGILKYDSYGLKFNYDFLGVGLNPAKDYCLIYAKDPWGAAKPLIDSGMTDSNGKLVLFGSKNLGDLPSLNDTNHPHGAKIWLLPCDEYTGSIGWPPHNDWLFDNWPGLINYEEGEIPIETKTVSIDEIGEDISSQYGYWHDYENNASISFTYDTPQDEKLTGIIHASGLKPYATYQIKLLGVPTCADSANGNDQANEYIGYKGRWTCVSGATCIGDANARNRTDAQYLARSHFKGDSSECIAGYLVWDHFTADGSGNASKTVETANSYHVLRCGGGVCDTINDSFLAYLDSSHPSVKFCPADKVNGQIERFTCGGLFLNPGIYNLKIALTEESFHQGNWATVLNSDINFEIK